jgi:hypothetical protein
MATSEPVVADHVRRQTGAVRLIVEGQRPPISTAGEIMTKVQGTTFVDDSAIVLEYDGGSIEYVPAAMTPDALGETIINGRVIYKFTVTGGPPPTERHLNAGTYYLYIDFIEGPDFDEGRWIGRILDANGAVKNVVIGIEVKQLITFHVGEDDRASHYKPEMHVHGIGIGEDARRLDDNEFVLKAGATGWKVIHGDWTPHGTGCARTSYCVPC